MQPLDQIFVVVIIIFSAVIHEVMHGVMADWLGDKTARYAGRLTLNPFVHMELFGSVLLPAFLALTNSPFLFGWAKPVPYNPYNLKPGRFSEALVAGAGPASNFGIALLFSALIRADIVPSINAIFFLVVATNIMLCIFNLIPVPPLDGSKVLSSLLPKSLQFRYDNWRSQLERAPLAGFGLVMLFLLTIGSSFGSAVYGIARSLAGI